MKEVGCLFILFLSLLSTFYNTLLFIYRIFYDTHSALNYIYLTHFD